MNRIIMLGTGHATVTHCYNTCFVLQTEATNLLVDAGGGNGILSQLERAHIDISTIHHLFVTHAHTDHILGVIWVIRMVLSAKHYEGLLHIYTHAKPLSVIQMMADAMLSAKHKALMPSRVQTHLLADGDTLAAGDIDLTCFDIHSTKEPQFGFRATLPSGCVVACMGDEPYNEACRPYVAHADWLLSEAFCLYDLRDHYKPYQKNHSTALDAGRVAQQLAVRHLLLYHTEDDHLATRRADYTAEAGRTYDGPVVVPDDLDVIDLE